MPAISKLRIRWDDQPYLTTRLLDFINSAEPYRKTFFPTGKSTPLNEWLTLRRCFYKVFVDQQAALDALVKRFKAGWYAKERGIKMPWLHPNQAVTSQPGSSSNADTALTEKEKAARAREKRRLANEKNTAKQRKESAERRARTKEGTEVGAAVDVKRKNVVQAANGHLPNLNGPRAQAAEGKRAVGAINDVAAPAGNGRSGYLVPPKATRKAAATAAVHEEIGREKARLANEIAAKAQAERELVERERAKKEAVRKEKEAARQAHREAAALQARREAEARESWVSPDRETVNELATTERAERERQRREQEERERAAAERAQREAAEREKKAQEGERDRWDREAWEMEAARIAQRDMAERLRLQELLAAREAELQEHKRRLEEEQAARQREVQRESPGGPLAPAPRVKEEPRNGVAPVGRSQHAASHDGVQVEVKVEPAA
ncbi:hypothetical protein IAT38_003819 [Cryptococcus sp. DSM 104549]